MNVQENREFCYAMNKMLQDIRELVAVVESANAEEANEMLVHVLQEWRYFGHHLIELKKSVECKCVENAKRNSNNKQIVTSISRKKELYGNGITGKNRKFNNYLPCMTLERATSELHQPYKLEKVDTKIQQSKANAALTNEKNLKHFFEQELLSTSLKEAKNATKNCSIFDHANDSNNHDNVDYNNYNRRNNVRCFNNNDAMQEFAELQTFSHEHHNSLAISESPIPPLWINVWPCFGSFQQCTASLRFLVHSQYKHISDVTERASKLLSCMPAPTHLYSPAGEKVYSLEELESDGHYLLFPSTGFYRREAVPSELLSLLVKSAQHVLC